MIEIISKSGSFVDSSCSQEVPVLEAGNNSFPNGRYTVRFEQGTDLSSYVVSHQIDHADLINSLVSKDLAKFVCTVLSPASNYRKCHIFQFPKHNLTWNKYDLVEPTFVTPMIVMSHPYSLKLDQDLHGVHESWHGRKIILKTGTKLAVGTSKEIPMSILNQLSFNENNELENGQFQVDLETREGFGFKVELATDLYRFLQTSTDNPTKSHILNHIANTCYDHLNSKKFKEGGELDEGHSFKGLHAISDYPNANELPNWSEDKSTPELVGTKLQPHIIVEEDYNNNVFRYQEFNGREYSKLTKDLIHPSAKGSVLQRDFLRLVRNSAAFIRYFNQEISIDGDTDIVPIANAMSEAEFIDPPWEIENKLFSSYPNLPLRTASKTAFWGRVTFRYIEEGRIESSYLAAIGAKSKRSGLERIDAALEASEENANKMIDDCVRSALRRLGGLKEARGNRSVYVNCPLSRGWWRERLVNEVASDNTKIKNMVRNSIHINQTYWEEIVNLMVLRKSSFGSNEVIHHFVRILSYELASDPQTSLGRNQELNRACRSLSKIQDSRELSILPKDELETIIISIISKIKYAINKY